MNTQMLQLLQSADDAVNCYSPPDFHWQQAIERVRQLKPQIEQAAGRPFEIDEHVQDASFFTDLALLVPADEPRVIATVLAIRFSAFGDLFTTWTWGAEQLPTPIVQEVITIVQGAGFHYVDAESLAEKYSGANPVFAGGTWWWRFFDYV